MTFTNQRKNILLIATGGTIASKRTDQGLAPVITSEELLNYVPEASKFCCINTIQVCCIDSTNIRQEHWLTIVRTIEENYNAYDGFVICHGTDTMSYTAAALSYLIQNADKPIVITGAQKPIDMENTDARVNLFDSLLLASDSRAKGVQIVFDGKVIAGTRARKMRTKSYNAFSSINYPHIATIQDSKIIFYILPETPAAPVCFYHTISAQVCVIKLLPGMKPAVLESIAALHDAVILESFGVGGIPEGEDFDFQNTVSRLLKQGKTIVMATQVVHEGSDMTVYKVGHIWKERYQLLESYDMTLESTVTKLMWILGQTKDPLEIESLFYKTINKDILYHETSASNGIHNFV